MRQNLRLLRFAQEALLLLLLGVASNMVLTLTLPLTLALALTLNPSLNPSPAPSQVNCLFILFCVRNSFSVLPSALHVAAGVAIGVALLAYAVEDSGANNTICLGNARLVEPSPSPYPYP